MKLERREIICFKHFQQNNNLFNLHKLILKNKNFKIDTKFDINRIWTEENVKMREVWLDIISKYEDFDDCYNKAKSKLDENTKRNKKWFKKYHELFYSFKNIDFKNKSAHLPSCLRFPDNTIYRLDGSHRCSIMKYLEYSYITVAIYDFEDMISDIPELYNCYKDYIIKIIQNTKMININK